MVCGKSALKTEEQVKIEHMSRKQFRVFWISWVVVLVGAMGTGGWFLTSAMIRSRNGPFVAASQEPQQKVQNVEQTTLVADASSAVKSREPAPAKDPEQAATVSTPDPVPVPPPPANPPQTAPSPAATTTTASAT